MSSAPTAARERELLAAARNGDEDAFRALVEPYRAELQAHCYRIAGSIHDAEDALQDAMLRAWRALSRFEGRSSARTWLYRIATNTCLDVVSRRPKRVLPIDYGPPAAPDEGPAAPLVESIWIGPYSDELLEDGLASPEARYEQRESVEIAFVAALQHLPANQRAALILRDVLGFSAQETAETLETTLAAVNSALQRARQAVEERLPDESQQSTLRALGDERIRDLVERYMDAMKRGDVDTVVAMLAEDATWTMPPLTIWFRGRDEIARFLADYAFTVRWRHVPTRVNGQPTAACYAWDEEQGIYVGSILDVLTLKGSAIAEVTSFGTYEVFSRLVPGTPPYATSRHFRRFGLPEELRE
jgi:RNA polymerase sigma-70 factor (ECF subfamily)